MKRTGGQFGLERLQGLSEGIFAIVSTILVLGLDMPEQKVIEDGGLRALQLAMEHQLRPYLASFASIAALWVTHVAIFHYIRRVDRPFIWLNLAFFFLVSLNPFITEMRGTYQGLPLTAVLYSFFLIADFLLLLLIWHYAANRLRSSPPAREIIRSLDRRIYGSIALYIVAALVSRYSERLATLILVCVPLLFLTHRKVDNAGAPGEGGP